MLDGELSQLERRMVAAHLERCADCRTFEEDVRDFTQKMREASPETPSVPVTVRRARRATLSAANVGVAAILAVAVLGVVSQLGPTGSRAPEVGARLASANLFVAGWKPERELASIDLRLPLRRPGPSPAI